jgi:myosin-1
MDDKKEFEHTRHALGVLSFNEEEQNILFGVCAAICHLGNLPLVAESKNSDNAVLKDKVAVENAARLLQVDPIKLEKGLLIQELKLLVGERSSPKTWMLLKLLLLVMP